MVYSVTVGTNEGDSMPRGKSWKRIADEEFAAMDPDAQAQWADLRELRMDS